VAPDTFPWAKEFSGCLLAAFSAPFSLLPLLLLERPVSRVTDAAPKSPDPEPDKRKLRLKRWRQPMLTLNRLDAIRAHRLHEKLGHAWRVSEERLANRRYRLLCKVYLHLHKALLRSQAVAA
jgi:hypothetical protein